MENIPKSARNAGQFSYPSQSNNFAPQDSMYDSSYQFDEPVNPFDLPENQITFNQYPFDPAEAESDAEENHRCAFDFDNQLDHNKIPIDLRALTMIDEIQTNSGRLYLEIQETQLCKEQLLLGNKRFTQYHVLGRDSLGPIDVLRRYSEFLMLRDMLFSRYPGLVIPPIPAKKMSGKLNVEIIEERKYFLDQFLKEICEASYLACCPELQVFMRPKQNTVAQSFKSLEKTTTTHVIKYYLIKLPLSNSPENIGESKIVDMQTEILHFVKYQKQLNDSLKNFKTHIQNIVPMKSQELKYYKNFAQFLQKYEDSSNADVNVKLITGDSKSHLKNKLDELSSQLKNPLVHIKNWIKGEIMNLETVNSALNELQACIRRKQNSIKMLNDSRQLISDINSGKFNFRVMLKTQEQKSKKQAQLVEQIQQQEKDIENWDHIKKILTIYIHDIAIPIYKTRKVKRYISAMQNFSFEEMYCAQKQQNCWSDFKKLTDIYMQKDFK